MEIQFVVWQTILVPGHLMVHRYSFNFLVLHARGRDRGDNDETTYRRDDRRGGRCGTIADGLSRGTWSADARHHRRAVHVSSACFTGGPVMNVTLAFALFSFLFLGSPANAQIYPQSRCLDCLKAAQDQLKQCLDSAISQEDKKSCAERQEAKAKVCEKGECEIERAKNANRNEVPPQKK